MSKLYEVGGNNIFPVVPPDGRVAHDQNTVYVSFNAEDVDAMGVANMEKKIIRTKEEFEAQ